MKQFIFSIFFWTAFLTNIFAQDNRQHLTFEGIPIDDSYFRFLEQLNKKGYYIFEEIENTDMPSAVGTFCGYEDCNLYLKYHVNDKTTYEIIIERTFSSFHSQDRFIGTIDNYIYSTYPIVKRMNHSDEVGCYKFLIYSQNNQLIGSITTSTENEDLFNTCIYFTDYENSYDSDTFLTNMEEEEDEEINLEETDSDKELIDPLDEIEDVTVYELNPNNNTMPKTDKTPKKEVNTNTDEKDKESGDDLWNTLFIIGGLYLLAKIFGGSSKDDDKERERKEKEKKKRQRRQRFLREEEERRRRQEEEDLAAWWFDQQNKNK